MVLAVFALAGWFAVSHTRGGTRASPVSPPATWRGLVGDAHPAVALGQRAIVVLRTPSVAQRLSRIKLATGQDERRWTAQVRAAQQQVLTQLARHGIDVRPDYTYARVLDGFAAPLSPPAIALLSRNPEVAGIFAVRAAFPTTLATSTLERGADALTAATLPGFDGNGVSIALLDTGVDRFQTYLGGRVQPGIDIVDGHDTADAQPNPQSPLDVERHGTELAGLLVGSGGPGGIHGAAPGANVLPIRIAGWQPDGRGRELVYARSDQLIAGLDRAVDPNGDGDAHDAVRIALIGVSEPFAGFADSPEAQAVAGALALDTLVVAPAGNDGPAGPLFGSIGGPGGAAAALTVGATDPRPTAAVVRLVLRRGLDVLVDRQAPLLGAVAPAGSLTLEAAAPRLGPGGVPRFTDRRGHSVVAGRAVLVPPGADPSSTAAAAAKAGARVVLFYGQVLPAGSLGSAGDIGVPVVGVPPPFGRQAVALIRRGVDVGAAVGTAETRANDGFGQVTPFSSRGLSYGGFLEPELSAPGVGIATSDPGAAADGEPAFATASGTSVAAAAVAGAAAVLAQVRPQLTAADLASLLVGSSRAAGARLTAGGNGTVDVGSSAVAEVAASQTAIAFGALSKGRRRAARTFTVRNVSTRRLRLGLTATANSRAATATVQPGRLSLGPGRQARVKVTVRHGSRSSAAIGTGLVTIRPSGSQPLRIPWVIGLRLPAGSLLGRPTLDREAFKPSDDRPAVLGVQIGRVAGGKVLQIEPAARLDVLLYNSNGGFLGVLSRLRDLLPGTYSFGITGRGPGGEVLGPGTYQLRLVAWPTLGTRPSRAQITFRILPA